MTDDPTPDIAPQLRDALTAHAETIEPSPDGLDRIEERLMNESTPTDTRRWWIGGASVAAALLIGAVAFVATDDDDSGVATETTSTTSSSTTTTTEATTTTAAPFTTDVDPYSVAYPGPLTSQRFSGPRQAGESYVTNVLGFDQYVLSDYLEGDSRSGEMTVSDASGNATSTILLRQMEDDNWYVLGSVAEDIDVETPAAGDEIGSPFETTGAALAFEGTVDVTVAPQDDLVDRGSDGFVTGSGVPPAGPFSGSISFSSPSSEAPGVVIYRILSPEDGHVTQATSFPVRLLPG